MPTPRRHRSHPAGPIAAAAAMLLAACDATPPPRAEEKASRFPALDMSDIMHAKLVCTEGIVNGLARGDLAQVADSAEAMRDLSERASWMVHDTVAYIALSETFREQLDAMIRHARSGDRGALVGDYAAITNTCLACHAYLQEERLESEMPGRISARPGPSAIRRIAAAIHAEP